MGWKSNKVSMPMTSAGIIGISSDVDISGISIDPRAIIVATFVFVGIVKLLDFIY